MRWGSIFVVLAESFLSLSPALLVFVPDAFGSNLWRVGEGTDDRVAGGLKLSHVAWPLFLFLRWTYPLIHKLLGGEFVFRRGK